MTRASASPRDRQGSLLQKTALTAGGLLLGGALTLGSVLGAGAQATPEAASGPCVPAAAPMAAPAATPANVAEAVATPGDQALQDAAVAAATNLVNCWNAGDVDAVLTLMTPNLMMQQFGVKDPAAAKALVAGGPFSVVSAGPAATYADGRASLDLVYMFGPHQYVDARWYMVREGDQLLIDQEQLLRPMPDGDTTIISFSVADDTSPVAFDQRNEITQSPVTILHGVNNGAERHIFQVLELPEGAGTPAAGETPTGDLIGTLSLGPGEQADMALVGLEPGNFVLVDPAVEGSVAPLTVAAPSS